MTQRKTYKMIDITSTSPESFSDAVRSGLAKAAETVRGMDWLEVLDQRGSIHDDGTIREFQVTFRVGFLVD